MVLVNKGKKDLFVLEEKLVSFLSNGTDIGVHYRYNDVTIRESITLDHFEISEKGLYLIGDWFQIYIESEISDVLYDENEDVVYIHFVNGSEMNIDTYR